MRREYKTEDNPILKMNPDYYFPLVNDNQDVIEHLKPKKTGGTINYSESGGRFIANNQNYFAYEVVKSRYRSGFLTFIQTSRSSTQYIFELYMGSSGTINILMSLFIYNNGILSATACTQDIDFTINTQTNTIYSVSWSLNNGTLTIFINGNKYTKKAYDEVLRSPLILIIGSNWREYEDDGTRAFDGYIKNLALWKNTLTKEQLLELSQLEY